MRNRKIGGLEGGLRAKGLFNKSSSSDNPLVSIITPCLNSEKYLKQTIESVIGQTYDNIEYIIVDGGSQDKTLDIIKKYEDKIAYWVSEPDRGLYDAMNKGIKLSVGEILFFLNSDDYFYDEEVVRKIIDEFVIHPFVEIIYGDIIVLDGKRQFIKLHSRVDKKYLYYDTICHQALFAKRRAFEAIGLFNEKYKIYADYDFILNSYFSGIKFHYLNKVIAYYRVGGISSLSRFYPARWREQYIVQKKYFGIFKALLEIRHFIKWLIVHKVFKDNLDHWMLQFYRKWIKRQRNEKAWSKEP